MTNRIRVTLCIFLVLCSLSAVGQVKEARPATDLLFRVKPTAPSFDLSTDITLEFSLKNVSRHKVLATREASLHDLIYLEVVDAHGKRIRWQGKIVSRSYPSDFFVVLEPGQSTTFRATISSPSGSGYQINEAGTYRVRAEFSLAPKEYFAPVSNGAVIPDRPVKSNWAQFAVKAKAPNKTQVGALVHELGHSSAKTD
jgi:hypothetical protein